MNEVAVFKKPQCKEIKRKGDYSDAFLCKPDNYGNYCSDPDGKLQKHLKSLKLTKGINKFCLIIICSHQ